MHATTDRNADGDRRRNPRVPFHLYLNQVVDDEPFLCRGINLSRQGIYVSTPPARRCEDLGRSVVVQFMLPGHHEPLWACGRVVRSDEQYSLRGSAINFTYVPETTQRAINGYMGDGDGRRERIAYC